MGALGSVFVELCSAMFLPLSLAWASVKLGPMNKGSIC
jgi:hypothetical protein